MSELTPREMERVLDTPGMMPPNHIDWLVETAPTVASWTEVGVYCGRSALAVGLALPQPALLQLVEIQLRSELFLTLEWLRSHRPFLIVVLCLATSVEAAKILPETEAVFIDDDHKYESVRESVLAWKDRCKLLCGHDYDPNNPPYPPHAGVRKAVDELCPETLHPCETGIWVRV